MTNSNFGPCEGERIDLQGVMPLRRARQEARLRQPRSPYRRPGSSTGLRRNVGSPNATLPFRPYGRKSERGPAPLAPALGLLLALFALVRGLTQCGARRRLGLAAGSIVTQNIASGLCCLWARLLVLCHAASPRRHHHVVADRAYWIELRQGSRPFMHSPIPGCD